MLKSLKICLIITLLLFIPFVAEGAKDETVNRENYEEKIQALHSFIQRNDLIPEEALEMLNEGLEDFPEFYEVYREQGYIHYQMGEYLKAAEHLEKYYESLSSEPTTDFVLALSYYQVDRYDESVEMYERALLGGIEKKEVFNKFVFSDPPQGSPSYHYGLALFQEGNYNNALDVFEEALESDPANAPEIRSMIGTSYLYLDNQEAALEIFYDLQSYYRNTPNEDFDTAVSYVEQGEYRDSLEHLEKARERHPGYYEIYFLLGRVHYELEKYERALEDLKYSRALGHNSNELVHYTAMSLNRLGQYEESVQMFIDVQDYYKDNPTEYYVSAKGHFDRGQYQDALKDLEQAVMNQPGNGFIYKLYGDTYFKIGEYEKAFMKYEEAFNLNPDNESAKNSMIFLRMHQKEYEKAHKIYGGFNFEGFNPLTKSSIFYYFLVAGSIILVSFFAILQCIRFTDVKEIIKGRNKNKITLSDIGEYKHENTTGEEVKFDVDVLFYELSEIIYDEVENASASELSKELLMKKKID